MKTKFNGILTLFLAFVVQFAFAQEKTISGTVSDESGMPLPGTTVLVKGTTTGTSTDFDGKYSINANQGATLVFSFVGYTTQEVTVGVSNTVNVSLQEDAESLDEVIITALGIEKKKDDDLSSSTTVSAEDIQKSGESGVIQGLAGKTSGLKITRNSGDPGAGAFIQIRGQNTILGNGSPLIVVDGIPMSNSSIGGDVDGVTQQSRLNDINPDDIENVTVLKGAAAAAVWGTGAANGVILINTKKGKGRNKVSVSVRSTIAIDVINIEFDKQNKFGQGVNGEYSLSGLSWGDKIADRSGGADGFIVGNQRLESITGNIIYPLDTNPDGSLAKNSREVFNQKNRDAIFGTGFTWDKSIGINFSGDVFKTYLSFSDWDQEGIIKGKSNYRRQTLRLNHVVDLTDKFSIQFNTSYAKVVSDRIQQGSNLNGLYLGYLRNAPDFDITDYKGTFYNSANVPTANYHRTYRNHVGGGGAIYNNPLWTINEQANPNQVERFTIAPQLTWKIKDNMSVIARYGIDYYTDHRETFFPVNSAGSGVGLYEQQDINEKVQNFNIFIQSSHDISDDFNLNWVLGTSLDRKELAWVTGTSENFTNPIVDDLRIFSNASAADNSIENYKEETRKHGAYATIGTELFNQLYFEFAGRYERPSTLETNLFYPSASFGWKFSEIIGENDILSFGKIRASYGEIGIEPQPYLLSSTFSAGGATSSVESSWGDGLNNAAYGNPFQRDVIAGNPDLKEERVKEFEVGADIRFFNNKITLGATYYDRTTEDAILDLPVPNSTGFTSQFRNAAEISNKGFEIDLSANIINSGDLKWSLNTMFSKNKSLVKSLSGVKEYGLNGFTSASSSLVEGEPFGVIFGNEFARDANGEMILENGFPTTTAGYEAVVLGDPNPDWIGGLGTVVSYKNFTLSAQFETSQGNDVWTGTEGVLNYFGISEVTANESVSNQDLRVYNSTDVIPAGTVFRGNIKDFGDGDVALTQSWYTAEGGGFGNVTEGFVKDASWTRLRELSLTYDFNTALIENTGITELQLSVTGRNLFLWTDIEGFDPDLNLTGASKGRGLDYFTNPATKSFLMTVTIGF
ncbi:SusC/RagA family TonB-linked outer membrane protein [Oceanihabitans sp. IOP_32]|uniref:SusC/RagA family TonB-linked outer membrane protein n=1 Tax=Oceanihabitans sp. IOP_32 TaxID=2529032 RepID=UPI001293D7CC|nr:SusC/RagA family TonB-linked outer membrane protein [Oceanihabitans sp. IOP_32]QFZ53871.1 SusC/RagA family TonB-linked outer membrane protein [Oceanihabitans sp. IOP_32]